MSKKLTNEEVDERIKNTNFRRIGNYEGKNVKIKFLCLCCNEEVKMSPESIWFGAKSCKKCATKKLHNLFADTQEEFEHKLKSKGINVIIVGEYYNQDTPIAVQCKNCGNITFPTPSNLLKSHKNTCNVCKYDNMRGSKNPMYNPNLTDEDRVLQRKYPAYVQFIQDVLKRDNYTCFITGKRGGDLEVHHIDGYDWCEDKRTDINNGITLSKDIHKLYHKIYGFKNANRKDFEEFCKKYKL